MKTNIIYNEDCIQGLKKLPDKSVDCIITDPPYGVGKKYDKFKDNIGEVIDLLNNVMPELKRVCKGTILVYASMKHLKQWLETNPDRILFFIKDYIQIMPCTIQYATDPILVFFGEEKPTNKPMIRDWFHLTTADTSKKPKLNHPTIKPLNAIRDLVKRFSKEGDIVLDCFMGSGTTALACKQLNRRYVGFEISPEYCKIIENRLKNNTTVSEFNPLNEESLISVKRESADSPNSPQTDNTNKEEANFS